MTKNLYQEPPREPGGRATEMEVAHRLRKKAKTMVKIAWTQDEKVGDGTASVIVLTAEVLGVAHQFLKDAAATKIDLENASVVSKVIQSWVDIKFIAKGSDRACDIAMDAVKAVTMTGRDQKEIDFKQYAEGEKVPGGMIKELTRQKSVMFNKDGIQPRMKRRIENANVMQNLENYVFTRREAVQCKINLCGSERRVVRHAGNADKVKEGSEHKEVGLSELQQEGRGQVQEGVVED